MYRREFLKSAATTTLTGAFAAGSPLAFNPARADESQVDSTDPSCCRTYATVAEAQRSVPETLLYVPAIYSGTPIQRPDYLATVNVDPQSGDYGRVVHRLPMPNVGDELHHFGWSTCSSCHGDPDRPRRYMIVPGITSGRIHVIDSEDPACPRLHHVVEAEEIASKTNLSAPHTVHCLASGEIMISMLGDGAGNGPGGFLLLDQDFRVVGRWERDARGMQFNYDFWYQPRHNIMISSEWGAPRTVATGFHLDDVKAGKYGQRLHCWDWTERRIVQSLDLGEQGMIPLEVRFHHDPNSVHGFVGAALSSVMWHFYRNDFGWNAEPVIQVESVPTDGWPFPVPGLITDLVLSLDDRWLYFSNWLHGDIRQYDVSDPARPKLTGQVWLGGAIGRDPHPALADRGLTGGPQMLQLSLDGRRLYVTNSLYSPWDNQFYPDMATRGSYLAKLNCDTERGGLSLAEDFFVDFGKEPDGPARAHEMRFPGGDCTSDIWL